MTVFQTAQQPTMKSLCVFCGARNGANPAFAQAATALGQTIAQLGWRLVYGAGDVGLMGTVARAAKAGDGVEYEKYEAMLSNMEKVRFSEGQVRLLRRRR